MYITKWINYYRIGKFIWTHPELFKDFDGGIMIKQSRYAEEYGGELHTIGLRIDDKKLWYESSKLIEK